MVSKDGTKIALCEIFESIDGEGFHAGQPTVFVRTFGCNLRCPWCFAPDTKGNYPFVLDEYGRSVSLDQVKIGDRILTKDPVVNEIQICTVTNVMSREADEKSIRRVNFGYSGLDRFAVTEEHPFYTDRWVPIGKIQKGEFVKRAQNSEIIRFLVENTYRALLVSYAQKAFETYENNHKDQPNFGARNGRYSKEYLERNFRYTKGGLLEMDTSDYPVKEFWGNKNLIVHHLDGNHENDSLENLVIVPRRIHDQLHSRGTNFSKQSSSPDLIELTFNKVRRNNSRKNNRVINIETDTHSYLVKNGNSLNAILVHNCDTKTSWTEEQYEKIYGRKPIWMTVDEIVTKVEGLEQGWPYKSICLTGGEPLMEENKDLISELIIRLGKEGYAVNIETNGAIDYKYWDDLRNSNLLCPACLDGYGNRAGISLITDWKLPNSKMNNLMIESNLEILTKYDLIKCVITDDPRDWEEFERICKSGTKAKLYLSPCFGQITMEKIPQFVVAHPEYNIACQLQQHKIFYSPDRLGV